METTPVRYVTTRDGMSIAYAVHGEGRPFVFLPLALSHMKYSWHLFGPWLEGLAARYQLVQYDSRGEGLSTRGLPESHSMADFEIDLEAVLDVLGIEQAVLFGGCHIGHVAVNFAVDHPGRVEALVLNCCSVSMRAWPQAFWGVVPNQNWRFFLTAMIADSIPPDVRERAVEELDESMTLADWNRYFHALEASTIEDQLPRLQAPTLVLHPVDFLQVPPGEAMKLASRVPQARLVLIGGGNRMYGAAAEGIAAVEQFLEELPATAGEPTVADGYPNRGLSTRQIQVLELVAGGKTNREIADRLVLSERTVQRHVADVYAKLGIRNRAEATAYALNRLSHA